MQGPYNKSRQGDVADDSADYAPVSASPFDSSSQQRDASADPANHALASALLVESNSQ